MYHGDYRHILAGFGCTFTAISHAVEVSRIDDACRLAEVAAVFTFIMGNGLLAHILRICRIGLVLQGQGDKAAVFITAQTVKLVAGIGRIVDNRQHHIGLGNFCRCKAFNIRNRCHRLAIAVFSGKALDLIRNYREIFAGRLEVNGQFPMCRTISMEGDIFLYRTVNHRDIDHRFRILRCCLMNHIALVFQHDNGF